MATEPDLAEVAKLLDRLDAGVPIDEACAELGIPKSQAYIWSAKYRRNKTIIRDEETGRTRTGYTDPRNYFVTTPAVPSANRPKLLGARQVVLAPRKKPSGE